MNPNLFSTKNLKLLLIIACSSFETFAQTNLVPNPSFEVYTTCPPTTNGMLQIDYVTYATGWHSSLATPEYFNACASPTQVGVPNNAFGTQAAYSGNAYCGFWCYSASSSYGQEAVQAQLTSPTIIGQKYDVSFRVSLADKSSFSYCAIDKIGALFSTKSYTNISPAPVNNFAHVFSNTIISNSIGWTEIAGSFIADSVYKYINIGNFFQNANLNMQVLNPSGSIAYYYIDEVSVRHDPLFNPVGFEDFDIYESITVFPNPTSGHLQISSKSNSEIKIGSYTIANMLGEIVSRGDLVTNNTTVNISGLENGLYEIHLQTQNGSMKKRFVKAD